MAENYFGLTDTGRQRQNNEDTFFTEEVLKGRFIAACVIDGVGGYEGGEVAASLARQSILDYFSVPSGSVLKMMQEALVAANEKIYQQRQQNAALNKMACVVTLVLVEKEANKFYYAHVGDTRLYLFRDQSLVKVTKDHSFVGFLEDSGRLDEDAAMAHPKRNEINRALGFEAPLANPGEYIETGESPFLPGDLLLLCSDGLTDMIDKKKIINTLNATTGLDQKAKELIDAANAAGGRDNITVVLVQNDYAPVKHEATKPVKKNETVTVEEKSPQKVFPSGTRPQKSHVLIIFLVLLTLLSLAGFLWQWTQKNKLENEISPLTTAAGNAAVAKRSNLFADTLKNLQTDSIVLTNAAFSDLVFIPDTLSISRNSLTIKGEGSTILTADTLAKDRSSIVIAPTVKYLLFDSLIIQDINLYIPAQNAQALHFKKVHMQNSNVFITNQMNDTLITGTLRELAQVKDSLVKKERQ